MNNYKEIDMLLMDKNDSPNIKLTDEMIENSLATFKEKPIVYNPKVDKQGCLKYNIINDNNTPIGCIKEAIYNKETGLVVGKVVIWKEKYFNINKYSNWQISINNEDKNKFDFLWVEISENK